MKKLITVIIMMSVFTNLFAGGLVTNLNQSAQYVRTLNRNASLDLDAVFYNPAGLTKLDNGFYAYFSNQSIFQVKGIDANYSDVTMNNTNFEGNTGVWFYPNIYLALKKDKFALSAGLMPIGGGGSAEYKDGLPSFEKVVAGIVPQLQQIGVTDYKYEVSFEGSSVYLGMQAGLSYEINEMVSVYGGVRFITANNTYDGYLKNIQVNPQGGEFMAPATFFYSRATSLTQAGNGLQPFIDGGAGGMTLAQLQAAQQIDAATVAQLEGALQQLGIDPTGYTVEQIQAAYQGASTQMQTQGAYLETVTGDKKLEAERTGHAYAAIIGVNFSPNEDLNVGFRYESKAAMTLKNDTKINTTGRTEFDDGEEFGADMPALAAFGLSYKMNNKLKLETSLNYFFDENVDWDKREKNLENAWEIGLGAEYMFTEDLCGSVGVLKTQTAASEKYRTDLDYGLDSYTVGFGIGYKLTDTFKLDFGALNTFYIDGENAAGDEEYYKNTMVASIGMSYKF